MYYDQSRQRPIELCSKGRVGKLDYNTGSVVFKDVDKSRTWNVETSHVYSYRSRRPRNAASSPVYGENLVKRGPAISGYTASVIAAVNALNSEAESTATSAGKSGRGDYDSGHAFYVRKQPVRVVHYTTTIPSYDYYRDRRVVWDDVWHGSVGIHAGYWLRYLPNLATGGSVDTATANAVQRLASATVPDRIHGSLGQDLVDLAQLPKFVSSLSKMARDLPALCERWHRLSHRARAAIDYAFRHPGKASKAAARQAGSGYLEWLFVLKPYVDDMQLIANYLSRGSSQLLMRESFTKNARVYEKTYSTTSGSYLDANFKSQVRNEVTVTRTVHIAVGWMAKGVTPSDSYFLTKAQALNRSLGLWYPSLLWDLTPWTWLLDWCLHFGDMIDNAYAIHESGYNPIYSWATVRERAVDHYSLAPVNSWARLDGDHAGNVSATALTRYPFTITGLQLPSLNGLSGSQRGVLAALGFSHLK